MTLHLWFRSPLPWTVLLVTDGAGCALLTTAEPNVGVGLRSGTVVRTDHDGEGASIAPVVPDDKLRRPDTDTGRADRGTCGVRSVARATGRWGCPCWGGGGTGSRNAVFMVADACGRRYSRSLGVALPVRQWLGQSQDNQGKHSGVE